MIQTYHLLDGGQITAASPEEFVRLLREGSRFDYDCTDQEYICLLYTSDAADEL